MNNKGFTLIEIIAVIGLLALIATMVGSSLVSMNQKQNQKNYDNYKETIAQAGCIYFESKNSTLYTSYDAALANNPPDSAKVERDYCVTDNHTCYISTKRLIESGYLSEDLVDPTTREKIKDKEVEEVAVIKYVNGRKTCCYYPCDEE